MGKMVETPFKSSKDYNWDNWCRKTSCHCNYLAGYSNSRCKDCEQEKRKTEWTYTEE